MPVFKTSAFGSLVAGKHPEKQSKRTLQDEYRMRMRATQTSQLGLGKRNGRTPSLPTITIPLADDGEPYAVPRKSARK